MFPDRPPQEKNLNAPVGPEDVKRIEALIHACLARGLKGRFIVDLPDGERAIDINPRAKSGSFVFFIVKKEVGGGMKTGYSLSRDGSKYILKADDREALSQEEVAEHFPSRQWPHESNVEYQKRLALEMKRGIDGHISLKRELEEEDSSVPPRQQFPGETFGASIRRRIKNIDIQDAQKVVTAGEAAEIEYIIEEIKNRKKS